MGKNGKQILSDIDHQVSKTRGRVQALNQKISRAQEDLESFRQQEADAYIELAQIRYDLLDDPDVVARISDAEKQAKASLTSRQDKRKALDTALDDNQAKQVGLEQKRENILSMIEHFSETVQAAENKALATLDNDGPYQETALRIETVEAQIMRIDGKIEGAQEDYVEKIKPYKGDPLFEYLWDRGYGTSAYKGASLFRVLDDWVARLCHYDVARRNYAMLCSIPEKLARHKGFLQDNIDALEAEQEQREQEAFEAGSAAKLQHDYTQKRSELEDIDRRIVTLEDEHKKILQDEEALSTNSDEFYNSAIQTLKNIYKSKALHKLRRDASITATQDDDDVVQNLYHLDDEIDDVEDMIETYRKSLKQESINLNEMQNVRQTFKSKKYDDHRRTFGSQNMFGILLGQFITGILTNAHFWSAVGRLCVEVLGELDSAAPRGSRGYRPRRQSRRSHRKSRRRKSSGGFKTGGHF